MEYTVVKMVTETEFYVLEQREVFSKSLLWDWQRRYFAEKGVAAWGTGEVPHYVTSNPAIADNYAEIVFAFRRDAERLRPGAEPLTVCELGGGSGRFAYHFLLRLLRLCRTAGVAPDTFRYVLTDFTQSNIDAFRRHPRFAPFFESGLLDVALFDVEQTDHLELQISGKTVGPGDLARPLVIIANYLFDTVPQELFYLEEGQCRPVLTSLALDKPPDGLDPAALLTAVQCRYEQAEPAEPFGDEPDLQALLAGYRKALLATHLLFPAAGLRCLRRLRALTQVGLLLLSSDKGGHHLAGLRDQKPPGLVRHGSFSLNVNFHAFWAYCEQGGGRALFPREHYASLNTACLFFLEGAERYRDTLLAYARGLHDFSPDDFHQVATHAQKATETMSLAEILAYTRLSRHDSHLFSRYLPRLRKMASQLGAGGREALTDAMEEVWAGYFPIGEKYDLAWHFGALFFTLADYARALFYFEHSLESHGALPGVVYDAALSHHRLGQTQQAVARLRQALEIDPNYAQARVLLAEYETAS